MPHIVPIKELRDTNKISTLCHEKNEPVFVTKQGYGDLVVMSMETYDRIVGIAETDAAIAASEREIAESADLPDARSALNALRRKHFG